jgi:hypothetical protein
MEPILVVDLSPDERQVVTASDMQDPLASTDVDQDVASVSDVSVSPILDNDVVVELRTGEIGIDLRKIRDDRRHWLALGA